MNTAARQSGCSRWRDFCWRRYCPSCSRWWQRGIERGGSNLWYISFAGGDGGVNNILVYHDSGWPHARPELLPTGKGDPPLRELRGFAVAGRLLYVVNAHESLSQILVYERNDDGPYRCKAVFASMAEVPSLVHPYDLTFDEQGNCYVSSQNTNVVTGLGTAGGVLEVAAHLRQLYPPPHTFLVGTRVASSLGMLPGIQAPHPPDVGMPHGLEVGFEDHTRKRVAHSVRGVVCHGSHLYVADEPADAVKVYEVGSGKFCGQIAGDDLRAPVQVLLGARPEMGAAVLYIGSSGNDRVVCYGLAQGVPAGTVAPRTFVHGRVKHVSGMAFDAEGNFYAAERKKKRIMKFGPGGSGEGVEFIGGLPDEPEFILHVPK